MNIKQNKLEVLKAGADDSLNLLDPMSMDAIEGGDCFTCSGEGGFTCNDFQVIDKPTPDPSEPVDPPTPAPEEPTDEPTDEPTEDPILCKIFVV